VLLAGAAVVIVGLPLVSAAFYMPHLFLSVSHRLGEWSTGWHV
jgi:hypothetical protein